MGGGSMGPTSCQDPLGIGAVLAKAWVMVATTWDVPNGGLATRAVIVASPDTDFSASPRRFRPTSVAAKTAAALAVDGTPPVPVVSPGVSLAAGLDTGVPA